jgi:hypothetical protein
MLNCLFRTLCTFIQRDLGGQRSVLVHACLPDVNFRLSDLGAEELEEVKGNSTKPTRTAAWQPHDLSDIGRRGFLVLPVASGLGCRKTERVRVSPGVSYKHIDVLRRSQGYFVSFERNTQAFKIISMIGDWEDQILVVVLDRPFDLPVAS